jgi:hypothetical protein
MISFIGIDPGQKGALCLLRKGQIKKLYDIPLLGRDIDKSALVSILTEMKGEGNCFALLERQHIMPRQAGQHKIGVQFGYIEMALAMLKIPYRIVSPQKWKKAFPFPKNAAKADSVRIASEVHPKAELKTKRGRILDGRADAILMAMFAQSFYTGEK